MKVVFPNTFSDQTFKFNGNENAKEKIKNFNT